MVRYYITDRRAAGGQERLLQYVERAIEAGVDFIQVRERDLSGRALTSLTAQILRLSAASPTRILVNDRTDIAMAAGAHGVHLRDGSVSPQHLRSLVPAGFVIAVSAHSRNGILRAQAEGADFVVFGPVFAPRSKEQAAPPKGLEGLRDAVSEVTMPVLALGGITLENAPFCVQAGASGIAAISLFQD